MTKTQPEIPKRLATESSYESDPGKGWILFAGIMLIVVGALNLVAGLAAVDNSTIYTRDVKFVFADLKTLGWILVVLGAAQLLSGIGVFRESELARWAGIGFASLNLLAQFVAAARASRLDADDLLRRHHHHLRPADLRRPGPPIAAGLTAGRSP